MPRTSLATFLQVPTPITQDQTHSLCIPKNLTRSTTVGAGSSYCNKSKSSSHKSVKEQTLSSLGNLVRLLPTGTVFTYQFLSPLLSNHGHCKTVNKYLTGILVCLCGLSCFFSTFTDSYVGDDEKTHYGIATKKGIWPSSDSKNVDLSAYRLRLADFVHAFFAVMVFAVVVVLHQNTVGCFYPISDSTENTLLEVLPTSVGGCSSVVFMIFPYKRNGIGYPCCTTTSSKDSKSGGSEEALTKT